MLQTEMQQAESRPARRLLEGGADGHAFPVPGQIENALGYLRARLALQAPKLALNSLQSGGILRVQRAPLRAHIKAVLHRHTPCNVPKELRGKNS